MKVKGAYLAILILGFIYYVITNLAFQLNYTYDNDPLNNALLTIMMIVPLLFLYLSYKSIVKLRWILIIQFVMTVFVVMVVLRG